MVAPNQASTLVGQNLVPNSSQGGDMSHLATGDEGIGGLLWQAEDLLQPAAHDLFD